MAAARAGVSRGSKLTVTTSNATGDADLYVRQASKPTKTLYNCKQDGIGGNSTCVINNPVAGTWWIGVFGYKAATFSIVATVGSVDKVADYVKRSKDKSSGVRLMGFGHRVYKNYDPRAKLMRDTCHEVLGELGLQNDRIFKLAMALEKIALEDDYFVSRKLYPNVDFYSGIVQRALGIPVSMFTCIFALARTVGWIAQWNEMIADPEQKIGRPRQLYTGASRRDVPPIAKR